MKFVKDSVTSLSEYFVLQDFSVVKLNQNESPFDVPAELKDKILKKLAEMNWNRYCENRPLALIRAIAEYTQFPESGIVAANASNEIIQAVFSTFCRQDDKIVVVTPGFSVYPRLAHLHEMTLVPVPLGVNFEFDVSQIIWAAAEAKMVILSSPNNPTGTTLPIEAVIQIAKGINGVFVLDEAYVDFHKISAQEYIHKFENLVIIRTFSKAFSLAGLRLGYVLAQPHIAKQLEKAKLPFSVGIFQQIAGEMLMKNHAAINKNVEIIISEREKLFAALTKFDQVHPIKSAANFIIFKIDGRSAQLAFELFYQNGILLRYFNEKQLSPFLRVTIGKPDENNKFLTVLKKILSK